MLRPEHVAVLRCPLSPAAAGLELSENEAALVCRCCRLKFPIREGIPALLAEEAELPEGVSRIQDLPCQKRPAGEAG